MRLREASQTASLLGRGPQGHAVVAVEGNKIRLGIKAPKSVRIDRAEIHQRRLEKTDLEVGELVLNY